MFKAILVPIDIAHRSSWDFAVPQAIELAQEAQGTVTVVTVVRDLRAMFEGTHFAFEIEQMMAKAREQLGAILSEHRAGSVPIEEEVRFGSISHEILDAAKKQGADLIVMASHRPEMKDYLIGQNAAHIAQHAECSVLVLRRFA